MIKLYIDQIVVSEGNDSSISLSFNAEDMLSVDSAREAEDITITFEGDERSASLIGHEGVLHAEERFNAEAHTATITYEDEAIVSGTAVMTKAQRVGEKRLYTIRIRLSGADWAHNIATTMLNKSAIDHTMLLTLTNIKEEWEGDAPYKFIPVYRDSYTTDSVSVSEGVVQTIRSIDDYHPFINIKSVVDSIFDTSEFEVVSDFFSSSDFAELYMSGAYSSQDNTAASDAMNFKVKKLSNEEAVANSFGRVYLTDEMTLNSVGNFVDIDSIGSDEECFSRNDCFTQIGNTLTFTPTAQVSVGFDIRLKYTADCRIESRDRLQTFDTVYLYDGNLVELTVVNQNEDLRASSIYTNFSYRVMVFDAEESDSYRLTCAIEDLGSYVTLGTWSGRTTTMTTPDVDDGAIGEITLEKLGSSGQYEACDMDWALYYGHVEEQSEISIDVKIRTSPKSVSPDSPIEFNGMFIQGGEAGDSFELLAGCSIEPIFATYPGVGTYVEFEEIAQHAYYQSEIFDSLQQMYNLRFYVDSTAKRLYVEPAEEIYDSSQQWDWSSKIDYDEEILFEDCALTEHELRFWGYQQGDGLVNRYETDYMVPGTTLPAAPESDPEQSVEGSYSEEFGGWCVGMDSTAALNSTESLRNSIFSPSLNDIDGLLIVGDRDDEDTANTLDFSPRIVRWLGLVESNYEQIPYIAFHSTYNDGMTLCFEDRDGLEGLNRYYRDEVERDDATQYVTLTLKLTPHEVAMLLSPTDGAASVLSTFRLLIDGEWAVCRLQAIEGYTLGTGSAKCKFLIVE